jgi:hypothetical protein
LRDGNGFASSDATASPAGTNGITAHLEFSSASVLEGDPVSVRAKGLRPGALATIHVQSIARDDAGKNQWFYGNATFMADARQNHGRGSVWPLVHQRAHGDCS